MIFFIVDESISFFNEIVINIKQKYGTCLTAFDAKLIIVLKKPQDCVKDVKTIRDTHECRTPILTMANDKLLCYSSVFFFNDRLIDININNFLNYLHGIENDITHVDCQFGYKGINLKTEIVSLLGIIIKLNNNIKNVNYSFNDKCSLHVTGKCLHSFTFSCFISNVCSSFYESITVFTRNHGVFVLNGENEQIHTYSERYGHCWEFLIEMIINNKIVVNQEYIERSLKVDRTFGSTHSRDSTVRTKRKHFVKFCTTTVR